MSPISGGTIATEEIQVNTWLREYVLQEDTTDGSYALVLTEDFPQEGILYDVEDTITHTTIVIDQIKLLGLDTLTEFSPFETIGDYTLETNLAWKYLALEADLIISVRPSTRSDSLVAVEAINTAPVIVEQVKLQMGVQNLEAGASLFAALNRTALEQDIRLGSLLKSSTAAMDCLLSTIVELDLLSLTVTAQDVITPTMSGFVSTGMDTLIGSGLEASLLLYKQLILDIAPNYFQTKLRPLLSTKLLQDYVLQRNGTKSDGTDNDGRTCVPWTTSALASAPSTSTVSSMNGVDVNDNDNDKDNDNGGTATTTRTVVDYRDLFLSSKDSLDLGGSGKEQYGDVFSTMIIPYLHKDLLNPTLMNEQWIPSLTKELQQHQEEEDEDKLNDVGSGTIVFENVWEYNYNSNNDDNKNDDELSLFNTIELRIAKITIANLDTVSGPLELLQPTNEGGNILRNRFGFETPNTQDRDQYLNVTVRVFLEIDKDNDDDVEESQSRSSVSQSSPFRMKNEIDFSLSLPSTSFSLGIIANLQEEALLDFPLKDITNLYCWLAALGNGGDDDDNKNDDLKNLAIHSLAFSMSTFFLDSNCVSGGDDEGGMSSTSRNSNSPGCDVISELFTHLVEEAGLTSSFSIKSIIVLLEDLLLSLWNSFDINQLLHESPKYCLHSEFYETETIQQAAAVSSPVLLQNPTLVGTTGISNNSSATILALGIIAVQSSIIVSAKNHLLILANNDRQIPLPTPSTLPKEGKGIIDFTNLSDKFGSWTDSALVEFRQYLSTEIPITTTRTNDNIKDNDDADAADADTDTVADTDDETNIFKTRNMVSSSSSSLSSNTNITTMTTTTTTTTPRVNSLLQDYVLDENGEFVIDLNNDENRNRTTFTNTMLGVTISLVTARITGLDSITSLNPLVVVDPSTLSTTLQLDELVIALDCTVTTIGRGSNTATAVTDQVQLIYKASGITVDVDTRIVLNTTEIGQLQLGSLFDLSHVVNCLMKGIQAFELLKLDLTIETLARPTVQGSLFSVERQASVNEILDSLHETYQQDVLQALPTMIRTTVRDTVNLLVPTLLKAMTSKCPAPPEFQSDGIVDFRELLRSSSEEQEESTETLDREGTNGSDTTSTSTTTSASASTYGNLFRVFYDLLDKEVMQTGASKRPVLNDLLQTLTTKQSNSTGTIRVAGLALDTQSVIELAGLRADLGLQVSDVLIQNLDSVGDPLHLFQPVDGEPHVLDNKLSFGVDAKPLQLQATLTLSLDDGADMQIRNEIAVAFEIEDVTVQASVLIQVLENSISTFPFEDFSNLNCWAASILPAADEEEEAEGVVFEGIQLLDQSYSTGAFAMDIACTSCTSPDFDALLLSLYEPKDITAALTEQTSSLMDSGFVQTFLNDIVNESKKRCPHLPEFDPTYDASDFTNSILLTDAAFSLVSSGEQTKNPKYYLFTYVNSIMAGCLIVIGLIGKIVVARRNTKWMRSLTNEGRFFLNCQNERQQVMEEWLTEHTTSLVTSPFIPKSVRWGVPFLLLVNIGLYLGGHLGLLSVINLDVTLAGQSFTLTNFLEFRFLESTKTTYNNGGAEMIILMWIFMGIWPYVKLLLSLVIWMVPPKYLGVTRRGTVLLWIDALARLSVIDIFTMILGFALILVFIGGPDEISSSGSEGVYYALKAIVVPKIGCYCIIVAQRMSRVSSQFLLEYHEKVVTEATEVHKGKEGDTSISHLVVEEQQQQQQIGESTSFEIDLLPSVRVTDMDRRSNNAYAVGTGNDGFSDDLTSRSGSSSSSSSDTPGSFFEIPTMSSWKVYRWGQLGAILGAITIAIVFVIGCVFAPAIAFDVSSIGGIAMESESTYEEAVSEYGVFLVISGILFKARFVLKTKADYIGLGLLLVAAGVSIGLMFVMKAYQFMKRKIRDRRQRQNNSNDNDDDEEEGRPTFGHEGCGLPSYFRLYKWKHMEIYFISVCIGVWQLGSIVSYSIHLYCLVLTGIFDILTSIGIVDPTEAQCNSVQASLPSSLVITLGSFAILLYTFYLQASDQYKKNFALATTYVDDKDVARLSLAWSRDKSKNSRYSHLTESLSLSQSGATTDDTNTMSSCSRTGRRTSLQSLLVRDSDSPGGAARSTLFTTTTTTSSSSSSIHRSPMEDTTTIGDILYGEEEISVQTPVALPIVDDDDVELSSTTIDAACELVAPTSMLTRNAAGTAAAIGTTTHRPQHETYQNFRHSLLSPWRRRSDTNNNDTDNINYEDDEALFYPSVSSSFPQASPSTPPPSIMTSRSTGDTSSITSPESPPPRLPQLFEVTTTTTPSTPLRSRSRVASSSASRSPQPRFQSTSEFIHHLE